MKARARGDRCVASQSHVPTPDVSRVDKELIRVRITKLSIIHGGAAEYNADLRHNL